MTILCLTALVASLQCTEKLNNDDVLEFTVKKNVLDVLRGRYINLETFISERKMSQVCKHL